MPPLSLQVVLFALIAVLTAPGAAADDSTMPTLAEAGRLERTTLEKLITAPSWARRAVAASRLARYRCPESRVLLEARLDDEAWQVRSFALLSFAIRRETPPAGWIDRETTPRVIRTALRLGIRPDADRLARGIDRLARSDRLDDRLLAAELAAAAGANDLDTLARELTKKVILRMSRVECGAFGPRLSVLTGESGIRGPHQWRQWALKTGRGFRVHSGCMPPGAAPPASLIEALPVERFAALEVYMEELGTRSVDLALCLDCTASMSGELNAAQSGMDDLIIFVGDVVGSLRVGLVAYRDRQDDFKTQGWDFTTDRTAFRSHLWQLTANGGGDTREAVFDALKLAMSKLSWDPEHVMVLVLVGDAAPHVGLGAKCVDLARRGDAAGLVTHTVQAAGRPVEHFADIADAGGGRCVDLGNDETLVPTIAGMTLGEVFEEEFREFFRPYLVMCR